MRAMRVWFVAVFFSGQLAGSFALADTVQVLARPEPVFRSGVEQSTCVNGLIEDAEQCDDNNAVNGDGCPTNCRLIQCGDGAKEPAEDCDDGSIDPANGCGGDFCEVTLGWYCEPGVVGVPASTSICITMCGDNIVAGNEQCDVGDTTNGDGCNSLCRFEIAPVAVDDVLVGSEDTPITIASSALTANDTDVNTDPLNAVSVQNAVNCNVSLGVGSISFTPASNFFGTASFEYTVSDGFLFDIGLVSVTVVAVNDPPVANAVGAVTLNENAVGFGINLTGSDVDSPAVTFAVDTPPAHGDLSAPNTTSNFSAIVNYTPDTNYSGSDDFTFHVSDGLLESATVTVMINVVDIPD